MRIGSQILKILYLNFEILQFKIYQFCGYLPKLGGDYQIRVHSLFSFFVLKENDFSASIWVNGIWVFDLRCIEYFYVLYLIYGDHINLRDRFFVRS